MSQELQSKLFHRIKSLLPPQQSLADVVASVLEVSSDSAYRRIRGDKALSLDEVHRLCTRFKISMDSLIDLPSNSFLFSGDFVQTESFRFDQYLTNVLQQVKYMNSFADRTMYYLCKDIPLFHHFQFREIAAFKYYFWMKNILHLPEFANRKFSMSIYPDEYFAIGRQILDHYNTINSIEVWNIESVNSTLRQIEYYHDSNIFASDEEIYMLYTALEKLIIHLENMATEGAKFANDDEERKPLSQFKMYFNEIMILENSIFVSLDGSRAAFLVHSVMNFMLTRDIRFCNSMHSYIQNLVKKSTLISMVSEKERARFFRHLRQKIEGRKQNLRV